MVRITDRIGSAEQAERLAARTRVLCAAPGYLEAHGEPRDIAILERHRLLAARLPLPWRLVGPAAVSVFVDRLRAAFQPIPPWERA